MDTAKLRAFWAHRQGLDGTLRGRDPAEVLERAGWARSVGGVGPYLTLFARAGTSRAAADAAVQALRIHELPAARGCTYVVPSSEFALALRAGREFGDGEMRVAAKLGVTEKEVEALCAAVVKALGAAGAKGTTAGHGATVGSGATAALDPDAIRAATGKASRSLGEAGKKKGLTTTLPLALGRLQRRGDIRRVPVNGRLDQQRYAYALWKPNPLAKDKRTTGDALTEMARRYFRWVGPATLLEFGWFAGLGVKATRQAAEPLGLVPAEPGGDRLLLPGDVAEFRAFRTPAKPQYALVSSLDAIAAARRDVRSLLDAQDMNRKVIADKVAVPVGGLSDLPSHAILDRGRLVGLWEFDPEAGSIVWAAFGAKDKALEAAVRDTEAFVRDELGDARSFSLDSPKSRASRLQSLRELRPAP
jgi:hypothetical protein